MMTNQIQQLDTYHEDLIHDLSYNYYGNRSKNKVWDLNEETGQWVMNESWKAHDCSILKVSWAHPEFGQVFASCSIDRTVKIWEEQEYGGKRWVEKAKIVESQGSVQDIEFAPNYLGLKLATISADGKLRIYEAMDIMNLIHWTLLEEIEVTSAGRESDGHYCLSWSTSRFHPPMIVVGCGKDNTARIYRLDQHNKWQICEVLNGHQDIVHDVAWAPNVGRSYQLIATACKDGRVRIFKFLNESLIEEFKDHGSEVWRVEWNVTGTILSSSGDDGKIRLWKASYNNEWKCLSVISAEQKK
ncbi:WD40 repeat-like protein [Neocallimastix lanati (nom. inval.)]|nr:WD40 repeat-like protein [Neocallimastix sp. JGI-2020a]